MCIGYELRGKKLDYFPAAVEDQLEVRPIYRSFKDGILQLKVLKNLMIYQKMQKII